jgi:hypothetical protein
MVVMNSALHSCYSLLLRSSVGFHFEVWLKLYTFIRNYTNIHALIQQAHYFCPE